MTQPVSYVRIFADAAGESHLEQLEMPLCARMFAPPAAPLEVSDPETASTFRMLRLAADWRGGWHPTPVRQWFFFLAGTASIETSDGAVHAASAGSIVLLEDTTGKGHDTRVTGNAEVLIAAVQVPGATSL